MKSNAIILILTISLVLLFSPAVSLAAGDHSGGGQGTTDMSGHSMDMSNHNMDMSGHNMDMPNQNMDMTGNGSMAGEDNDGMDHGNPASGTPGAGSSHGNGSHGSHNSQQGEGGGNVDGRTVAGGFGLINGLVILSAAILKRNSILAGGN